MKIYIHIGFPKCGSSSIQRYFSYNNTQDGFGYVALDKFGNIVHGEDLKIRAMRSSGKYFNGYNLSNDVNYAFIENFTKALQRCSERYDSILLSNELFCKQYAEFNMFRKVLAKYQIEIICIVRPPALLVNSSYWQWAHWMENREELYSNLSSSSHAKFWFEAYEQFSALPYVQNVHMFALQENIIKQLCLLMNVGYSANEDIISNQGSSAELLSFLSMKRSLRPSANAASLEFCLNRYVSKRSPLTWVLTHECVESILNNNKEYSLALAKIINNENILENAAWWDVNFYAERIASINMNLDLPYTTLVDMLEEAYHIICKLDNKLAKFECNEFKLKQKK